MSASAVGAMLITSRHHIARDAAVGLRVLTRERAVIRKNVSHHEPRCSPIRQRVPIQIALADDADDASIRGDL